MDRIRFAIVGGGWRSEFFVRAAQALPEQFELTGVWMRSAEKAEAYARRLNVPATSNLDRALQGAPDFVVCALSPWQPHMEAAKELISRGLPVLMETPPAPDIEGLNELWRFCRDHGARVMSAEEYAFQPYWAAVLALTRQGVIGAPTHALISMMHGYHCAAIARQILGTGMAEFTVRARAWERPMAKTYADRVGEISEYPPSTSRQVCAAVDFAGGQTLLYDFCDAQYFSLIRSPLARLSGERGEILNDQALYIGPDGACACESLRRVDLGGRANLRPLSHRGYMFEGRWVYENPFPDAPLTDDEIAVAAVMREMKRYLDTGRARYTLADACQDAYIHFALQQAAATGEVFASRPQAWSGHEGA